MVFHAVDATAPYNEPDGWIQRGKGSRTLYHSPPWDRCGGRKLSQFGEVT